MSDPAWLDSDEDEITADDLLGSSPGFGAKISPQHSATLTATPPPKTKEPPPEFLRATSPQAKALTSDFGDEKAGSSSQNDSNTPYVDSPVDATPVVSKKNSASIKSASNGDLIEVDFGDEKRGSKDSATNAPVHFLRRMQDAEKAKKERKERRKLKEIAGVDTAAPEKKEKKKKSSHTPRQRNDDTLTTGPSMAEVIASGGIEDTTANVDLSVIPEISDENKVKFAELIKELGEEFVAKLVSNKWQHRHMVMQDFKPKALELIDNEPIKSWSIISEVVSVGIPDSVMQVFTASTDVLLECIRQTSFLDERAVVALETVGKTLSLRLRDSNTRVRDTTTTSFVRLSEHKSIGPVFTLDIVCTTDGSAANDSRSWMALITKMDCAVAVIKGDEGLMKSCKDILMKLCVQALNCNNAKVRKRAMAFATDLYKAIGKDIEDYLSSVSAATVRMLRQELEMEVCDAKPLDDDQRLEDEDVAAFDAEDSISEEHAVLAEIWADTMSLRSAKCIFSSKWKLREKLVDRLHQRVLESIKCGSGSAPKNFINFKDGRTMQGLVQLEEKALNDTVPAVVATAIPLVKSTIPMISPAFIQEFCTPLVTVLLRKHTQSPQTAEAATDCIIVAAKHPKFGAKLTCSLVMDPEGFLGRDITKTSHKIVISRLELLAKLIATFGFDDSGLVIDECMKFALQAFEHPNVKARASGATVIVESYKQAGNVVQSYLQNLKGALLDELKEKIQAVARKDRTRTAPIQRLANIVQPLSSPQAKARPMTTGVEPDGRESGASVRQRILEWNEVKKAEESPAKASSEPRNILESASSGGGSSSTFDRPPARSTKKREQIMSLAKGHVDDEFGEGEDDEDSGNLNLMTKQDSIAARPKAPNKKSRIMFPT